MQVVYERSAGIDVHKKNVVVCWITPGDGQTWHKEVRSFGTMTDDLLALGDWLRAGVVSQIAMESTGV
jgi:hypothetical protein